MIDHHIPKATFQGLDFQVFYAAHLDYTKGNGVPSEKMFEQRQDVHALTNDKGEHLTTQEALFLEDWLLHHEGHLVALHWNNIVGCLLCTQAALGKYS